MSRVLSIEVGYSLTKICEMDFRSKQPKIYKYFSIPTPEGVYDDGFLQENPDFYNAIKGILAADKIKTKQCVCTITSSKIATREVLIPAVKTSQVSALIEANASDYFPIDLSEYELGHLVLGYTKDTDGTQKLKCMVMACGKTLIEGYEKLAAGCGLHLISVDYSGNSIYQIMKGEVKEETEMVIKVDERNSIASIISGQNLVMQRTFAYGVENAIMTMMNSPAFPQRTFTDALDEMKRITCIKLALNENTVMIESEEEVEVSAKVAEAMKEITESLAPLIGNIARVLDLYNSKNTDSPVKRVILIGMGSDISGLSKLFTNELQIKTIIADNIHGISWNHNAGMGTSGRYVTTIGAGLAPIGFINEEKKKSDLKDVNYRNVAILSAILFILLCAILMVMGYSEYRTQELEQKTLKNQEAQYLPAEQVYKDYQAVEALYNEILAADKLCSSENDNLIAFLTDIEKMFPEDAILEEFTSDNDQAVLKMKSEKLEYAAKLAEKFRAFESVMDVRVDTVTVTEPEGADDGTGEAKTEKKEASEEKKAEESKDSEDSRTTVFYESVITVVFWSSLENSEDANTGVVSQDLTEEYLEEGGNN